MGTIPYIKVKVSVVSVSGYGDVVVENGIITAVGKIVSEAAGAALDMSGCTLFPGFVDSHVHVAVSPDGYSDEALKAWAYNGVTTVKELGTGSREIYIR